MKRRRTEAALVLAGVIALFAVLLVLLAVQIIFEKGLHDSPR